MINGEAVCWTCISLHIHRPLFLTDFNQISLLSTWFCKNICSVKCHGNLCHVGAEFCNADGQTDKTKLTVAFRNLRRRPPPPPKEKVAYEEDKSVDGVLMPLVLWSQMPMTRDIHINRLN